MRTLIDVINNFFLDLLAAHFVILRGACNALRGHLHRIFDVDSHAFFGSMPIMWEKPTFYTNNFKNVLNFLLYV